MSSFFDLNAIVDVEKDVVEDLEDENYISSNSAGYQYDSFDMRTYSEILRGSSMDMDALSLSQLNTDDLVELTPTTSVLNKNVTYSSLKSKSGLINPTTVLGKPKRPASSSKKLNFHEVKRQCNPWTDEEDILLMSTWYRISNDSIAGNKQKDVVRWSTVFEEYESVRKEQPDKYSYRTIEGMKTHYQRLSRNISCWISCLNHAKRGAPASGTNQHDDHKMAQDMYSQLNKGKPFTHLAVYNSTMRDSQKWSTNMDDYGVNLNVSGSSSSKRSRTDKETTPSTTNDERCGSVNGDDEVGPDLHSRPMGRDLTKKARKGKGPMSNNNDDERMGRLDKVVGEVSLIEDKRLRRKEYEVDVLERKTKLELIKLYNTLCANPQKNEGEIIVQQQLARQLFP